MPRVKKDRFKRREVQEAMESVQDAVDELEELIETPLGSVNDGGDSDTSAKFGDVVALDPSSGAITVSLPSLDETKQAQVVTVINRSASTNNIVIAAADGDNINGAASITMSTAWDRRICIAAGPHDWVAS